jgi:predicted transcriptional regulator
LYLKITNKIGSTNYPAIKDKELNNSLADLAAGKFVSHDEVRRKVKLLFEKFEK